MKEINIECRMAESGCKKKSFVIIDCDTGNDDAWAIISLVKAEERCDYKILGITCVYGNTTVDNSTVNTLMVLERLGRMDVSNVKTRDFLVKFFCDRFQCLLVVLQI